MRYLVKWIVNKKNDKTPFQVWHSMVLRYDKPHIILEAVIDADHGESEVKAVFSIYFSYFKILKMIKVHDNFEISKKNYYYQNRTSLYFEPEDQEKVINKVNIINKRFDAIRENT